MLNAQFVCSITENKIYDISVIMSIQRTNNSFYYVSVSIYFTILHIKTVEVKKYPYLLFYYYYHY